MKYFLSIIILVAFTFGCSKTDTDVEDLGTDYYPIIEGRYAVYDVTEIEYDDFTDSIVTNKYELKILVDSAFTDGAGRTQNLLKFYTRLSDTIPWKLSKQGSVFKSNERVEENLNNQVEVKMSFPLRLNKSWDGNALNSLDPQNYLITNYNLNYSLNGEAYEHTVWIDQGSSVNLIEEKVATEVYARLVGLISKTDVDLIKDVDGTIVSGHDYSWKLTSLGPQ